VRAGAGWDLRGGGEVWAGWHEAVNAAHEPRLWFSGEGDSDLDLRWRAYVRRFDLEHAIRFLKQAISLTVPRVRHPEQADQWTWRQASILSQDLPRLKDKLRPLL
jgi:hypothetical protein